MNNPFEFFGIKPSLAIDLKQLRMKFLEIQRSSHPDFGGDDATNSELANQFYEKLKEPTSRIQNLLENYSGKFEWVATENFFGEKYNKKECFELDSCDGGLGKSGGGCYKWAETANDPRLVW